MSGPLILSLSFQEKKIDKNYILRNLCVKFRVTEYAYLIKILLEVLNTEVDVSSETKVLIYKFFKVIKIYLHIKKPLVWPTL